MKAYKYYNDISGRQFFSMSPCEESANDPDYKKYTLVGEVDVDDLDGEIDFVDYAGDVQMKDGRVFHLETIHSSVRGEIPVWREGESS